MLGLMYLGFAILYLWLMFIVVRGAWRGGAGEKRSWTGGTIYAAVALLLFNMPLFGNYIPVTLSHRSMCQKDGGFKVYVTPEAWVSAHRDEIASLSDTDREAMSPGRELPDGFRRSERLGGLLASESLSQPRMVYGIRVLRVEERLRDARTNTLMAVLVDYRIGSREDVRLWFAGKGCFSRDDTTNPFYANIQYRQKLRELSK